MSGALMISSDGIVSDAEISKCTRLNLSSLSGDGVISFGKHVGKIGNEVREVSLRGSTLDPKSYIALLSLILHDRVFSRLEALDLSYYNLPEICLHFLCEYLSPISGGYNISRLNVTRCNLGTHGTQQLLKSLFANNTITDILLTGNKCEDSTIPTLVTMLTKYTNQVKYICLGANKLTSAGVQWLLPVLEGLDQKLMTLSLANNPDIGDDVIEPLFVSLNKGNFLTTLSLSNCGISKCEWARYLPFMNKLETLDLSYNTIDDSEFPKLCKVLERCYCLKHLDLGHNRFGGLKSNVVEQMLVSNGALQTLSLCGNRCDDAVWAAIFRGLAKNDVLLELNLTECNITLPNAMVLCRMFADNDICSLLLDNNPLPPQLIADPRVWYATQVATTATSTTAITTGNTTTDLSKSKSKASAAPPAAPPKPLNPQAHVLSIARSNAWIASRVKEVSLSLNSLSIAAERKPHIPQLNPPDDSNSLSFLASLESRAASDGPGTTGANNRGTQCQTLRTPAKPTSTSVSITSPELIAQSEVYLSPHALQALVAESDLANTSEKRLIHVGYGRAALVIGCIEITSLTTYAAAHKLVEPLVREYVSTIAANEAVYKDLVEKYCVVDAEGNKLAPAEYERRRVWPEFCRFSEPVVVVRPGNWVQL